MRPEDEALQDRFKSMLGESRRIRTDIAAKRLSMGVDELVNRVKAMKNTSNLVTDGNRIVEPLSVYKTAGNAVRDTITSNESDVLEAFHERFGSQFIENGMVTGYKIGGGHVISLKLTALGLKALPSRVSELPCLEHLDISNNAMTMLPGSIMHLERLRHLDIGNNRLTNLPRDMDQLVNLERLDATCNMLSPLPEAICRLARLKRLDVSNNKLTMLPESIGNLTALVELRAAGNYLSSLPDSLGTLHALECLDLENNFINALPACIESLQKDCLKQLALAGNPMRGSGENREPWD